MCTIEAGIFSDGLEVKNASKPVFIMLYSPTPV
jgi:hypothetical protein